MMTHSGEKPNKCNHCDSSFLRKYCLLRHMKRHNEEKTKKAQKYGPDLELHGYSNKLLEGESIGKFQCNLCGKISDRRNGSFKHVENVHFPGTYQYECEKCGQTFGTQNKIVQHRMRLHSGKKQNEEKTKKPSNYNKLQTIVKLGLHLAMEKSNILQMKERSTSDGNGDDVEVVWSDYCDTVALG